MELHRLRAETEAGEKKIKYALYDAYEADSYPGELVCESDDIAAIKLAAIAYMEDCDGECLMHLVKERE